MISTRGQYLESIILAEQFAKAIERRKQPGYVIQNHLNPILARDVLKDLEDLYQSLQDEIKEWEIRTSNSYGYDYFAIGIKLCDQRIIESCLVPNLLVTL